MNSNGNTDSGWNQVAAGSCPDRPHPWPPVILHPASAEDEPFLLDVYADHRKEELGKVAWSGNELRIFLAQQFNAQSHHYRTHFPEARHDIIAMEGTPIGRIYVDYREEEIRLLDISLLGEYRNQGIGTIIMTDLVCEATNTAKPLRLYVYKWNRAVRFYERLGFHVIEDTGVHYFMERQPGRGPTRLTGGEPKSTIQRGDI